jgi:hypothetical protein
MATQGIIGRVYFVSLIGEQSLCDEAVIVVVVHNQKVRACHVVLRERSASSKPRRNPA